MSIESESLPYTEQVLGICSCGAPLYPVINEDGKRIGVTHETIDDDDNHFKFFAGLRVDTKKERQDMKTLRRIWMNVFFRMFVIVPGTWVVPFVFFGLDKMMAAGLYLLVFFLAVYDNENVWS